MSEPQQSTSSTSKAKAKAPAKRPERVGVKRGPYRPREKPNWNKEILAEERAEKKRQKKMEKKQARIKPPKAKPLPPLTSLPVEVLDLIIVNILPIAHPLADHLPHPSETPYPPLTLNVTSSLKSKSERWGSVPQRVLDIINFGKCCRQTMHAVERVIGGLGGSTKVMDGVGSKRQLFLRIGHYGTSGDLLALASKSRSTLEHIVLHHCGGEHGSRNMWQEDNANPSPINQTKPLQHGQPEDYVALPRLRSVQIGPDVCAECSQICLVLFAGRTFYRKTTDGQPEFSLSRFHAGYNSGWSSTTFDHVAAPELEAIQILVPNSKSNSRHVSYLAAVDRSVDEDLRQKVKTFSLILPANERKWGGFGVGGHSSSVHQESREDVEKALAERAKADLIAPGLSNRRGKGDTQIKAVKERWALLPKAPVAKPSPSATLTATQAVAAALVSSIRPVKKASPLTLADVTSEDASTPADADTPDGPTPDAPTPSEASLPRRLIQTETFGPKITEYDRQAVANRIKRHDQYQSLLRDIANTFPHLVSLQVLRRGNTRVDIVEDVMSVDEYVAVYVTPLRKLHKLEQLDLGLAVVGRREVRDFPLGLVLPVVPPGATPIVMREVEARRRIMLADIAHAVREGDEWRMRVLERFVQGTDKAPSEESGLMPATLADAEDAPLPTGWPKGVKSGFVYSTDLKQRGMHRGVLTTWKKAEAQGSDKGGVKRGVAMAKSLISL